LISFLLILHALVGVTLLGALAHQTVSMLRRHPARTGSFLDRYSGVHQATFTKAVVCLYVAQLILGAVIYPTYRLNVRIPFEEMSMGWAVGIFEMKEHFAAIGLVLLPLYFASWQPQANGASFPQRDRLGMTLILAFIVVWDFLVGHVLNNIRGLG
jgi:hypothetical protein